MGVSLCINPGSHIYGCVLVLPIWCSLISMVSVVQCVWKWFLWFPKLMRFLLPPDAPILRPMFSYNISGIENSSAILSLTAMSVPSVLGVVWTKEGLVLANNLSKYSISFSNSSPGPLSNASLTILGLKVTDGGLYLCTVNNSFKATSVPFNLVVMSEYSLGSYRECVCVCVCICGY